MSQTRAVQVSVPRDLLEEFDEARGLIPRSALITDLMRRFLGETSD